MLSTGYMLVTSFIEYENIVSRYNFTALTLSLSLSLSFSLSKLNFQNSLKSYPVYKWSEPLERDFAELGGGTNEYELKTTNE